MVINELTWPDQEYLHALQGILKDLGRRSSIYVVHNFKETESKKEFREMRQVTHLISYKI